MTILAEIESSIAAIEAKIPVGTTLSSLAAEIETALGKAKTSIAAGLESAAVSVVEDIVPQTKVFFDVAAELQALGAKPAQRNDPSYLAKSSDPYERTDEGGGE